MAIPTAARTSSRRLRAVLPALAARRPRAAHPPVVYDCDGEIASASDEPVAIACGLTQPTFIALAGEDVYVTEHGFGYADGSLARVPKLGGLLEPVVPAQLAPWAITASDDYVYWSNYGDDANGSLNRLSLADAPVDILASGLRYPWDIALHDGSLYATESNNSRVLAVRPNLSVEVLAEGQIIPTPLAVDDTGLFVGIQGESPPNDSPIRFIDHGGGQAELYTGVERAELVLLDGNDLYFGTDDGLIRRGTRDGAPLVTLADSGSIMVDATIADGFLYFTVLMAGWVGRVPLDGGEVEVLATGQDYPEGIVVDGDAIYWVSQAGGRVLRLAK